MKKLGILTAATLLAASAQAAFITGSIGFSDGFDAGALPGAPTGSIVSNLTSFNVQNGINVFSAGSGTTAFAGVNDGRAFDFGAATVPTTWFTATGGGKTWTFTLTSLSKSASQGLSCNAGGLCGDEVDWDMTGIVDDGAGGLDPTLFVGQWGSTGNCLGAGAQCTSDISATWQATITATGRQAVSEPASLALLGLGLAGLGIARRRKA